MADIKFQAYRDDQKQGDFDQRKSKGEWRGASEGMNVKTLLEFRVDKDGEDILTNPERVAELIHTGDNALAVLNRIIEKATNGATGALGPAKSALPWNNLGFFCYDND